MSRKKRFKISKKQKNKRRKRRAKLKSQESNPDEFFSSGFYVGKFGR